MKRKQKEDLENMEVGEMLKKVRKNLQKEIQMTTLVQNIFQVSCICIVRKMFYLVGWISLY